MSKGLQKVTQKIDGHVYAIITSYPNKSDAKGYAERTRKYYRSVRVLKKSGRYCVFVMKEHS